MMYGWGYNHMGTGMWILMVLGMLVFWTAVVVGVVVLVKHFAAPSGTPTSSPVEPPEQILRSRLARGEIDEDEFRTRLAVLKEHV